MIRNMLEQYRKLIVGIYFTVFLFIGLAAFDDFGIPWDEHRSREDGARAFRYIVERDAGYLEYKDIDYGPALEILIIGAEILLEMYRYPSIGFHELLSGFVEIEDVLLRDMRPVYLMRHIFNFLLFYLAVYLFYRVLTYKFGSWKAGLAGALLLILSPRIFADAFYNSKDVGCLSMFIISLYTLIRYIERPTMIRAMSHALSSAILIDIRISGLMMPFFTMLCAAREIFAGRTDKHVSRKLIISFLVYACLVIMLTILFWPMLWQDPAANLIKAVANMAKFRWESTVLYMGSDVMSTDLPWHYIPVWIGITTPVSYTILFVLGTLLILKRVVLRKAGYTGTRRDFLDVISLVWFFTPILGVVALRVVLYDAWRQLFFIYPAFLIVSMTGAVYMLKAVRAGSGWNASKIAAITLLIFTGADMAGTAYFMIKHHPFQNVYFNVFASRGRADINERFERDYYGLSYRQALEYILKNDPGDKIKIYVENWPGMANYMILPFNEKKRLNYVGDPLTADYYLTNHRWFKGQPPYGPEFYSIHVDGVRIMSVYKIDRQP